MLGQFERFEECTRQLELGMVTWRELVREAPQNDDFALGLAHTLQTRATLMFYSGDATAAGALFTEAGEVADQALAVRPENPTYRRVRRKVWESLAEVGIASGNDDAAVQAARHLTDEKLAPIEPVLAGALIARCIPLAENPEVAAGYRAEALGLLQAAINRGVGIDDWRKNPTLGGQWNQPGFQELVDDLTRAGG
jgi:hypothetical protein